MNIETFIKNTEKSLAVLENEYCLSTEHFSPEKIEEDFEDGDSEQEVISAWLNETVTLYLPRCEYDYDIEVKDLEAYIDELKSAKLIDNVECYTKKRFLVRVHPVYSDNASEFYSAMNHIENKLDGAFLTTIQVSGIDCKCRITSGATIFGVIVASNGSYDKYFPPVTPDDIFIEIEYSDKQIDLELARNIYKSFIFELSASIGLDFSISPRPEIIDDDEDDHAEDEFPDKVRPLIIGKGLSEPLDLYNKAIESPSDDISILYFAKVIEFVSQTVIKIQLIDKVRTKLLSRRALNPEADFITELEKVYESNKVYRKDREALKVTIATCCDASELTELIPGKIKKQWMTNLRKNNEEHALSELAASIVSTRNSIAHAKANYDPTGSEIPVSDYESLAKCMKVCAQQAIRWYSGRHEAQRIY
ncbi:MAG: hypothetical protein OIF51_10675 [Cellvibrionaceae bacterium]|nr:hypothetical protein [Cellvibrionaceae bacterium]